MLIQQCPNCNSEYNNNQQRVAMFSCIQKHKICNICLQALRSANESCPTCHKQLLRDNIQASEIIVYNLIRGFSCALLALLIFIVLVILFVFLMLELIW